MDDKMPDFQLLKLEKSLLMVDNWLNVLEMLQISIFSTVSMSGIRSVASTLMPSIADVMHFSCSVQKNKYQDLI